MTLVTNPKLLRPLYTPVPGKTMHVVVFGSGQGTNLEALLEAQSRDPSCFVIKALLADRPCRFQEIGHASGLPVIDHSFHRYITAKGLTNGTYAARMHYDEEAVRLLLTCARQYQFSIDLIVLAGYMRLIQAPLLTLFKVINVHPADLRILDKQGKRRYVGMHSVYDALIAGETKTCSSVILVDAHLDGGPILTVGPSVPYTEGYPVTEERAKNHQTKQKSLSDWPACLMAVKMIAQGRLSIDGDNNVYVDSSKDK